MRQLKKEIEEGRVDKNVLKNTGVQTKKAKDKSQKKIPKFYLKDILFNKEKVEMLAGEIENAFRFFAAQNNHKDNKVHNDYKNIKYLFAKEEFVKDILEKFPELELKGRLHHIKDVLHKHFQKNNFSFLESVEIIMKALPKELDNTLKDGDFGDFIHAPYAEYVATYGLDKKYLKHSLKALEEITKRFSAEWAVRPFWDAFEEEVLEQFLTWSKSGNYHVRRLASEGSRPRLPWGKKINLHYKKTEKLLDNLYTDGARYVTRSVANHLNDISKIDKNFVLNILEKWEKENRKTKIQTEKEMEFIKKHATRTLRKKGNL